MLDAAAEEDEGPAEGNRAGKTPRLRIAPFLVAPFRWYRLVPPALSLLGIIIIIMGSTKLWPDPAATTVGGAVAPCGCHADEEEDDAAAAAKPAALVNDGADDVATPRWLGPSMSGEGCMTRWYTHERYRFFLLTLHRIMLLVHEDDGGEFNDDACNRPLDDE